jgi:fatty-acid desaturase
VNDSQRHINRSVVVWLAAMHLACLAAPFHCTRAAVIVAVVLHALTGCVGITLTYHRCLSHRSLKLARPVRWFGLLCGVLANQGPPLLWVATHRLHHAHSDQAGDPHSPVDGRWWSHFGWILVAQTPAQRQALVERYAPELLHDPMIAWFERSFLAWKLVSGLVLFACGGLPMLIWGLCVRTVALYHSTWLVNSATHLWGYRRYPTRDRSRNLWWVALLSYGEGWHNNHHARPHGARAGHRWWELDPTFWLIRALERLGLAHAVDDRGLNPRARPAAR